MEIAGVGADGGEYRAGDSARRLVGDLQGLTQYNPVGEAAIACLAFLAGDKPAVVGDVTVLDS